MWEPLYCSALTGKCTRCVKECLCLSLALPPSNPTFQSRHERGLFIGFSFFFFSRKKKKKKKKKKCLSNLHSWTWKCSGASLRAFLLVLLSWSRSPADFRLSDVSPRFPCQAIFLGFFCLSCTCFSLGLFYPHILFAFHQFHKHRIFLTHALFSSLFSARASDSLSFPNSIRCFPSAVWHLRDCV